MKPDQAGPLLALASMVTLGISNYLYKRSTDTIGPVNATFFYYLFSLLPATLGWLALGEKERISWSGLAWPALLAIVLFTSVWTFNQAVARIDVSVASTIRSLNFVVTIGLAILLSQEKLTLRDWVAVAFATAAILLFSTRND